MIPESFKNIKARLHQGSGGQGWLGDNKNDVLFALSFFFIAVLSFGLGRLSITIEQKDVFPVSIEENSLPSGTKESNIEKSGGGALLYVGSKNGSAYHLPSCSGASRISDTNKIWFSSKEEAEALGYHPAKNCDGL